MGAGLTITFSLWWLYFDKIDGSVIRKFRDEAKSGLYITWLYTHFPLVVGLCATAAGISHLVSADQGTVLPYLDELLICWFCCSLFIFYWSYTYLHFLRKWRNEANITIVSLQIHRWLCNNPYSYSRTSNVTSIFDTDCRYYLYNTDIN